jgi:DNA-binding winged helix-turn-helix (wHTH) protein/tetratricopeptide (TPR) repeat protein
MPISKRYAFGDFVLEPSQHRLRGRDETPVPLSPRLFFALQLFVERAGVLLDKDELVLALWPGRVVEENNLSQVISGLRRALGDDIRNSRYIQTVARRGFRFIAEVTEQPARAANNTITTRELSIQHKLPLQATLAVLPFVPLATESRDDLLEIGMADSLISRLSGVDGLVVRSVGSVRRFAGLDQDPLAAARALDVAWVVDGSLQRSGDQLRVTARLLSAPAGVAAWSGSFDLTFTDVFDMQDLISTQVAQVLKPTLGARVRKGVGTGVRLSDAGGSRNADAYQLYLAARQHAQGIRADGLRKSIELYHKALTIDPRYAMAYAGLGETYRRMLFGADRSPTEVFEPYRKAILLALEIAPELAEAHAQLGWIHFWFDFDWLAAERVFRHALRINPNVVGAHFGLGFLLLTLDRAEEGIAHIRWARELDPLSLILNAMEAGFLLDMGRRDEAAARLDRAFEIEPNFWVAHIIRAMLHLVDREPEQAIAALRRADQLADQSTQAAALLGVQLARLQKPDEAREVLHQLLSLQQTRYVPPTSLAAVHAALGQVTQALDALDCAWVARDTRLVYLKDDSRWTGLRQQPRFAALLRLMKLDGYGPGISGP